MLALMAPPPPSSLPVVFAVVYGLLILFQGQFHKGRQQSGTGDICPFECVRISGLEQVEQGWASPGQLPQVCLPSH